MTLEVNTQGVTSFCHNSKQIIVWIAMLKCQLLSFFSVILQFGKPSLAGCLWGTE